MTNEMKIKENTGNTKKFTVEFTHAQMDELAMFADNNCISNTEAIREILINELCCE